MPPVGPLPRRRSPAVGPAIALSGSLNSRWSTATMPAGVNGIAWCDDQVSGNRCDQHYVRLATTRVHAGASTACHETAHAVGLTHGANAHPTVANDHGFLRCLRTSGTTDSELGAHNPGSDQWNVLRPSDTTSARASS